ncbi:MAG: flagellar brake protein [Candidatus Zixiibacteriota bacterium]
MPIVTSHLREPLKLWEKVEVEVGEGDDAGRYIARIEDFVKEGIVISTPEFIGGNKLLRDNVDVAVIITREDAVYQFHSHLKRIQTHLKSIYQLENPTEIRRIQRRQFVRIEKRAEVLYARLTSAKTKTPRRIRIKWNRSEIVDISAGGALMKAHEKLQADDILVLHIPFLKDLGLPEHIVSLCRRTFHERHKHFVGLEFITSDRLTRYLDSNELDTLPKSVVDFDFAAQNKLAAYVFNQQIELRKKGLL